VKPSKTMLAFALVPLALGMADAAISLRFAAPSTHITPRNWAPQWIFPVAWSILYPTFGLAAWNVWKERANQEVGGVLALFAVYLVNNLFFMPINGQVGGNPLVLTMMDLNGVVATAILAWAAARISRTSLHWLCPLLAWMPITFGLKVWLTLANR